MIILVGESGSGKSTIEKILDEKYGYKKTVSYTTRPQREGDVPGKTYIFISKEEFETYIQLLDICYAQFKAKEFLNRKEELEEELVVFLDVTGRVGNMMLVQPFLCFLQGTPQIQPFLLPLKSAFHLILTYSLLFFIYRS